ncbi:MAG: DUF924 family protein [Gammaproteobacteria bacterium]|nr:DUF924 family protein [Gammaproteobacteria bacterium]
MNTTPAAVIEYWIGDVLRDVAFLDSAFKRWFNGGDAVDTEIRERFGAAVEIALEGGLREWEDTIRDSLALVILLDQFPRNIHRSTPRAFAGDDRALAIAQRWQDSRDFTALDYPEQVFLLMPYQHVEEIDTQEEGVRRFRALEDEACQTGAPCAVVKWLAATREYAELHRDIIARFGRFPHRNRILERESTAEETAWMEEGGQNFGQ